MNTVTLLRQRYIQTHKLVIAHMNALVEICNPTNSSSALQLFYDSMKVMHEASPHLNSYEIHMVLC